MERYDVRQRSARLDELFQPAQAAEGDVRAENFNAGSMFVRTVRAICAMVTMLEIAPV